MMGGNGLCSLRFLLLLIFMFILVFVVIVYDVVYGDDCLLFFWQFFWVFDFVYEILGELGINFKYGKMIFDEVLYYGLDFDEFIMCMCICY